QEETAVHPTHLPARLSLPALSWAWRWRLFAVLCLVLFVMVEAFAASVPTGFLDKQLFKGLTSPSAMGALPDGRVLIVQQNGVIRIVKNDAVLAANFYNVANVDSSSERGCLGV